MVTRIVIVTYNWPPRNAIGTHRAYAWARHWAEEGATVTVLTSKKQAFDSPLDLELPNPPGIRVIEVPFGGTATLASHAMKFEFPRFLAKTIKSLLNRRQQRRLDPRAGWHPAAQATASTLAAEADIVVSTFGPAAAHLIATDMKKSNPALRWVADYRDLWSQRHCLGISDSALDAMRREELKTVAKWADLVTTVSSDLARQLAELTGKRVLQVPNGFDITEATIRARMTAPPKCPGKPMRIVYTGMLYDRTQDPRPLLDAIDQLYTQGRIEEGDLTVDFYGSRLEPVQRLSRNRAYARFIRILGHVPREDALEAQANAGLLLLLESPLPEARGVLTGKVFEYIAAGRPILCVGSRPEYEIGRVLSATGTGVVCGPDEYPSIDKIVFDTLRGGGLYAEYSPNVGEILRYSREKIAKDMLSRIAA